MSVRGTKKRAVIFLLRYDILGSERRKFRISHVDPSLFQYFVEYSTGVSAPRVSILSGITTLGLSKGEAVFQFLAR